MNRKMCIALVVMMLVMSLAATALAGSTDSPVPKSTEGAPTPTPVPQSSVSSSSDDGDSGSSYRRPAATPEPLAPAAAPVEVAKAENVAVESSNPNVTVATPDRLPSAAMANAVVAIRPENGLTPKASCAVVITATSFEPVTVSFDLSKEIASKNVQIGAHCLGRVIYIIGGVVYTFDVETLYMGRGTVAANFTADQLALMAGADEVVYTLLTD